MDLHVLAPRISVKGSSERFSLCMQRLPDQGETERAMATMRNSPRPGETLREDELQRTYTYIMAKKPTGPADAGLS